MNKKAFPLFAISCLMLLGTGSLLAQNLVYYNALEAPFEVTGAPYRGPNGELRRLPAEVSTKLQSKEVEGRLVYHTAGVVIRFRTNSDHITLSAELNHVDLMTHMTIHGAQGMQLATESGPNHKLFRCGCPSPANCVKAKEPGFTGTIPMGGRWTLNNGGKLRNLTLYLPLYSGVSKVRIGLDEGARVEKPLPHKIPKPICFYGSSITQGCSASNPGRSYSNLLCAALDAEQRNLGFSNSAHGDAAMAEYIASLDMSAFVMDYDYNASNVQELQNRHQAFFRTIREKQPDLPILILSGPRDPKDKRAQDFRRVIRQTYDNAVAAGDKNVYFVDGSSYYDEIPWSATTVDMTHPTDLGFYLMYSKVLPVLKQALHVQ